MSAGQSTQAEEEVLPERGLTVPAGHWTGGEVEEGQYEPVEQRAGAPVKHVKVAGQGTQVSWRMRAP